MTEDEAKGKWCPFVRFVSSTIGEHDCFPNRPTPPGVADVTMCLGSACMAWRTHELRTSGGVMKMHGYCGLAGSPQ